MYIRQEVGCIVHSLKISKNLGSETSKLTHVLSHIRTSHDIIHLISHYSTIQRKVGGNQAWAIDLKGELGMSV